MFHVVKHGVGREAAASIVIMLCFLKFFDDVGDARNLPERLSRAYKVFALWCIAEGKTSSLKNFTRANLHCHTSAKFPYLGGKGSDTTLVLMWLEFYLQICLLDRPQGHAALLKAMQQQARSTLQYLGVMHSHDLWLPLPCARFMMLEGLKALRSYSYCARAALAMRYRLFCMRPKFHLWAHTIFDLKQSVDSGHAWHLNPCVWNCEQSEDFIGRISRISRHVSTRTTILRTMQRYGLGFQKKLRLMKKASKSRARA